MKKEDSMKRIRITKSLLIVLLLFGIVFLVACTREALRPSGEPFDGYSCRESFLHFYSRCSNESLKKEDFEAKVRFCENELATKICDKEIAALLWCMGRVEPGIYSKGSDAAFPIGKGFVFSSGKSNVKDGCDCSSFISDLRKCRMQNGIFD